MKIRKTIAIVDDHSLFRKGIMALLRDFEEIDVLFEAGDGNELLSLLKTKQPHVILLDISMPGLTGIEITTTLKQKHPSIRVIILSQYFDNQTIYKLMQKGANGFLPKDAEIETIVEAIHMVTEKGNYFTEAVAEALAKGAISSEKNKLPFNAPALTNREIEVLRLICKEKTIKDIGTILHLSPRTIDTYIEKLYQKTGARKREGLVFYAVDNGLL